MKVSCRRIISFVLAGMMLSGVGALAYFQTFTPPRVGSGRVIESQIASGSFAPYVNQSVYSVETLYVLTPSPTYTYVDLASSFVATSSPGRRAFTYNTGYGGSGSRIYLQGCPNVNSFYEYSVSGSWGA